MWTTGPLTTVYLLTQGTSSEIFTKKADTEKKENEVASKDVTAGQGRTSGKPRAHVRGWAGGADRPGDLVQTLSVSQWGS